MFVAVDVTGTNSKSEEQIINQCIDDCVTSLFPLSNDIIAISVIVVEQEDLPSNNTYAVVDDDDDGEYSILLSKSALEDDVTLYKTIAHECVHIKQYFTKELESIDSNKTKFKNKVYNLADTPYNKRPWEIEAYKLEEEIYKCSDVIV